MITINIRSLIICSPCLIKYKRWGPILPRHDLCLKSVHSWMNLTFGTGSDKYELAYGLSYTLTITDDQRSQVLLLLNMRTKMMFNLLFTYTSANLFFKKKPAAGYLLQTIP